MNRNRLNTIVVALTLLLILGFLLPALLRLVLGTVWLILRIVFLAVLIALLLQWCREQRK